ncbi:hypothetical protein QJS66_16970 [Kocuria rhizophila]|nr:hypothetical protein QJS66_16970 [Kocuria rhizophila]
MSERTSTWTPWSSISTPDTELPWAELGLNEAEFERIKEILGRAPRPRRSWPCTP